MAGKRYYWFKLKKDFFKRHDIRILESMQDGEKIVLFYLKLLCESVDHDGALRFSDTVPYTPQMLASVTGTELSVVTRALDILQELELLVIDKKSTMHMMNIENMFDSAVDNDNANRQRRYRQKKKAVTEPLRKVTDSVTKSNAGVTEGVTKNNQSIELEKELDIELELEKELELSNKKKCAVEPARRARTAAPFKKPTIEEVSEYCKERGNKVNPQAFCDFYEAVGWRIGNKPMKDWRACVRTWETRGNGQKSFREVPIMENNYDFSPEAMAEEERKSLDELDRLLEE